MLEHGGRLRAAAARTGRPLADWVDLSTGINPIPYPLPAVPVTCWQRLPEDEDDGLTELAARHYGAQAALPVAGSQPAIMALPRIFKQRLDALKVCLPQPMYAEHAAAWSGEGHETSAVDSVDWLQAATEADVALCCNPCNPDGHHWPAEALLRLAEAMRPKGGWLIVDEAFADATPRQSIARQAGTDDYPNLIVLRSLGKFFGLAGARVGFVLAAPFLLQALRDQLGPWHVSHPSRWAAGLALADRDWQAETRQRLLTTSRRLARLLAPLGTVTATPLFCWLPTPCAAPWHSALLDAGILVRLFAEPSALRFGLPTDEAGWKRLAAAVATLAAEG